MVINNAQEWQTSNNLYDMITYLGGSRIPADAMSGPNNEFLLMCCERFEQRFPEAARQALKVARGFAEGTASREELQAAQAQLSEDLNALNNQSWVYDTREKRDRSSLRMVSKAIDGMLDPAHVHDHMRSVRHCAEEIIYTRDLVDRHPLEAAEEYRQFQEEASGWLRDMFGPDPRQPLPAMTPNWVQAYDGAVRRIADGVASGILPTDEVPHMADALMDAGCNDSVILEGCNAARPHTRNNWVVRAVRAASAGLNPG